MALSQNHHASVRTARRNGSTGTRGYTVSLTPAIRQEQAYEDIEGVGMWRYNPPRVHNLHSVHWYKFRDDAQRCADEFNKGERHLVACNCSKCKGK